MFEEMVVSNPTNKKTNKPWTVFISMAVQVLFLAILILIPLIYTEALPKTSDVFHSFGAASASAATPASGRRAGDSQACAAFDGRRQVGDAEGHPEGPQDY